MARSTSVVRKADIPPPIQLPIEFEVGDVPLLAASEMVVQSNGHETIFSFFQVDPPLIVGTPEQQAAMLKRHRSVKAKCLARVSIASSKLAGMGSPQQGVPPLRMLPPG